MGRRYGISGVRSDDPKRIDDAIKSATPVTLEGLWSRPFLVRLLERVLWLGSPYL